MTELVSSYELQNSTDNNAPEEVSNDQEDKEFQDALCLQTKLVYILIGNYFDIPRIMTDPSRTKCKHVEWRHFFIWSLLAEGATLKRTKEENGQDDKQSNKTERESKAGVDGKNKLKRKPEQTKEVETADKSTDTRESKMSVQIWKESEEKDKIFEALFAVSLLKSMSKQSTDEKEDLAELAKEFNKEAIQEVTKMYKEDEEKARLDVAYKRVTNSMTKGHMSIFDFALKSRNLDFLMEPVCKTILDEKWMGNIIGKQSVKKILFCLIFLPFFTIYLVSFKDTTWDKKEEMIKLYKKNRKEELKRKKKQGKEKKQDKGNKNGENNRQDIEDEMIEKYIHENMFKEKSKLVLFFKAPVVRFLLNGLFYVTFLGYFSFVLVIQYSSNLTNDDIILLSFVGIIFLEEVLPSMKRRLKPEHKKLENFQPGREHWDGPIKDERPDMERSMSLRSHILGRKISSKLSSPNGVWFILNLVSTMFFIIGYGLKFADRIEESRVVMGFDLILLYVRSLQVFCIHKRLGPKILMIGHMFKDLCYFILILMVFVVSYGIAAQSIMYPVSELNMKFALNLLKRAYWNIYGELMIEELEQKEPDCTFDKALYSNDTLPRCPTEIAIVWVPIMMGLYILMSNILLLNLLIAMFSSTYDAIQNNSERLWNYHRIYLIKRYKSQTWIPLFTLYYVVRIIHHIFSNTLGKLCTKPCRDCGSKKKRTCKKCGKKFCKKCCKKFCKKCKEDDENAVDAEPETESNNPNKKPTQNGIETAQSLTIIEL